MAPVVDFQAISEYQNFREANATSTNESASQREVIRNTNHWLRFHGIVALHALMLGEKEMDKGRWTIDERCLTTIHRHRSNPYSQTKVDNSEAQPLLLRAILRIVIENLRTPQSWDDLFDIIETKYYPHRFEIKDLVAALLYACPTDTLRFQFVQLLHSQGIPIPFVYVHLEQNSSENFEQFRYLSWNLLLVQLTPVEGTPLVFGFGSGNQSGKSGFINELYGLKHPAAFPEKSKSVMHDGSIDVILDTPLSNRGHALAECHGDLLEHAKRIGFFSEFACAILIQLTVHDISNVTRWQGILNLICQAERHCRAVVIVIWGGLKLKYAVEVQQLTRDLSKALGHSICILSVDEDGAPADRNAIRAQYFDYLAERGLEPSLTRQKVEQPAQGVAMMRQMEVPPQLTTLRGNIFQQVKKGLTEKVMPIFPYSEIFSEMCALKQEMATLLSSSVSSAREESLKQQKLGDMQLKLREMEMNQVTHQPHSLLKLFLYLTESDLFWFLYDEFAKALQAWREPQIAPLRAEAHRLVADVKDLAIKVLPDNPRLLALKEDLKSIHSKIDKVNVWPDHFWREATHIQQAMLQYDILPYPPEFGLKDKTLVQAIRTALVWSVPLEIINGDTMSMMADVMAKVFGEGQDIDSGADAFVVSILAAQGSDRSLLRRYLFPSPAEDGSGGASGVGTRGLYAAVHQVEFQTCRYLVVLDIFGFLSPMGMKEQDENRMLITSMACSHTTVVHIRGNADSKPEDLIRKVVSAASRFIGMPLPPIVWVLSDMEEFGIHTPQDALEYITIHVRARCLEEDIGPMEDLFDISAETVRFFPPVWNQTDVYMHEIPCYGAMTPKPQHMWSQAQANHPFIAELRELLELLMIKHAPQLKDSPFFGCMNEWVAHIKAVWRTLAKGTDLKGLAWFREYDHLQASSAHTAEISKQAYDLSFPTDLQALMSEIELKIREQEHPDYPEARKILRDNADNLLSKDIDTFTHQLAWLQEKKMKAQKEEGKYRLNRIIQLWVDQWLAYSWYHMRAECYWYKTQVDLQGLRDAIHQVSALHDNEELLHLASPRHKVMPKALPGKQRKGHYGVSKNPEPDTIKAPSDPQIMFPPSPETDDLDDVALEESAFDQLYTKIQTPIGELVVDGEWLNIIRSGMAHELQDPELDRIDMEIATGLPKDAISGEGVPALRASWNAMAQDPQKLKVQIVSHSMVQSSRNLSAISDIDFVDLFSYLETKIQSYVDDIKSCVPLDTYLVSTTTRRVVNMLDNTEAEILMVYHCVFSERLRSLALLEFLCRLAELHSVATRVYVQNYLNKRFNKKAYMKVYELTISDQLTDHSTVLDLLAGHITENLLSPQQIDIFTIKAANDIERRFSTNTLEAVRAMADERTYIAEDWKAMLEYNLDPELYLRTLLRDSKWTAIRDEAFVKVNRELVGVMETSRQRIVEYLKQYQRAVHQFSPIQPPAEDATHDEKMRYQYICHCHYLHFRAFMCFHSESWKPPVNLWQDVPPITKAPKPVEDFGHLFDGLVDRTIGIAEPLKFVVELIDKIAGHSIECVDRIAFLPEIEQAIQGRCLSKSVGCNARCPFCGAKCSHSLGDGHPHHACSEHLIAGLSNRKRISIRETLWSCTNEYHDPDAQFPVYGAPNESYQFLPYMERFYGKWRIPFLPQGEPKANLHILKTRRIWMHIGKQIQDKWGRMTEDDPLEACFPGWWAIDVADNCQFCHKKMLPEHPQKDLPCRHRMHDDCIRLFQKQKHKKCLFCRLNV